MIGTLLIIIWFAIGLVHFWKTFRPKTVGGLVLLFLIGGPFGAWVWLWISFGKLMSIKVLK